MTLSTFPFSLNETIPPSFTMTVQVWLLQNTPGVSWTPSTFPSGLPRRPGACFTRPGTTEKSTFASAIFFSQSPLSSSGPVIAPPSYLKRQRPLEVSPQAVVAKANFS